MKHSYLWSVVILAGIATIFVVSRLVSPGPESVSREEFALDLEQVEEAAEIPSEPAGTSEEPEYAFDMTEEADGSTRLSGEGFTIVVPKDWIITAGVGEVPSGDQFIDDRREILAELRNVEPDEMTDPDVVSLNVERITKKGRTYEEVVDAWTWTTDDAEAQAAFMRESASAPYNEITAEDIDVEAGKDHLGDNEVDYAYFSCTTYCYIEGNPPTWLRYFFDAGDNVYAVFVHIVTGENTEAFLDEASSIAETFEVK